MREWQIGDPVDGTTDGWLDAQNWGRGGGEEEQSHSSEINPMHSKRDRYSKMAWDYHMDYQEEDALYYIDLALDLDKFHSNNWNKKAIFLEALKRYEESEECYNESLRLSKSNMVYDNKARMLYDWAVDLREESKKLANGLEMLEKAKQISIRAINARPGEYSEEDINKYLKLKESIDFYIQYEKKFQRNLEKIKSYSKDELFTITGRRFLENNIPLAPGMALKLVREPDNEFDSDAIAVYVQNEKIGYVANNDYTKYELTSKASKLKGKMKDTAQAEYLLYLDRYAEIQFAIGRLI